MDILLTILLIISSGFFSGLTIGLMSLSYSEVKRASDLGNKKATKVLKVIESKNMLLVTLLLGNTAINSTLAIFLGSLIGAGVAAGVISTFLILIFGEILPAALLSKYALEVGALSANLVKFLMFVATPISKPIAFLLDRYIGKDIASYLSRKELIYIINEHANSESTDIDEQDSRLIGGVLHLTHKKVKDYMTPKKIVVSFEENNFFNKKTFDKIQSLPYSKFPITNSQNDVIGIINLKKLIGIDLNSFFYKNNSSKIDYINKSFIYTDREDSLDDVLSKMIDSKTHFAIVNSELNYFIGIITLNDILEEILQLEI
jgi:metal transporter CNNM